VAEGFGELNCSKRTGSNAMVGPMRLSACLSAVRVERPWSGWRAMPQAPPSQGYRRASQCDVQKSPADSKFRTMALLYRPPREEVNERRNSCLP
jgi:hypothetical protein